MSESETRKAVPAESSWHYTLTDLIDLDLLQRIQDSFATATQVASTITDVHGYPITKVSNHSEVCLLVRQSKKGLANCIKSAEAIGRNAAAVLKPFHQACLSCGFTDAAAPIIVEGHHIANWLIGQYYTRDVDDRHIAEYAAAIDIDQKLMVTAFQKMPRLSREHFEKILDFLWLMANEISRMGYLNLRLKEQTTELERIQQELRYQKEGLESAVEKRTQELKTANALLSQEIIEKDIMQKEQDRLHTAIENLGEAIAITDIEGTIIYVNPAFSDMTGYTSKEVLGKNLRILNSGKHTEAFFREFWNTLSTQGTWSGRFINKHKDGTIYTEESTVSVVRDETGKVINYVATKRDISKELEMERQLLQAAKLESIGTLAAGIAHEINTPVQYIGSNLDFLQDAFSDLQKIIVSIEQQPPAAPESVMEQLEEVDWGYLNDEIPKTFQQSKDGIRQISSIVLAMKEFSHPGTRAMAPANLNKMLGSVMTVSQNEWKYVATVTTNFHVTLRDIPCLANEISQVFLNIIVNAAQAIAEQQNDQPDAPKGQITISTGEENESAVITIADNGPGIPAEILEKIFDPFFTTKSVGKGTGQGLAIAYDTVVKKHGGTIDCRSTKGAGAEFRITLPFNIAQENE